MVLVYSWDLGASKKFQAARKSSRYARARAYPPLQLHHPPSLTSSARRATQSALAMAAAIVLPGDEISPSALPTGTGKRKTLKLGPGLRHIPPSAVVTTVAGALVTDNKKNAASVEFNSGRVRALSHQLYYHKAHAHASTCRIPETWS